MRYIARLADDGHIEDLRKYGEIIFEAKLLPIIGIFTTPHKAEIIKKLPYVMSIEQERIGGFYD